MGIVELVNATCTAGDTCWPSCDPQCISTQFFNRSGWASNVSTRILGDTFWVSFSDLDDFIAPHPRSTSLVDLLIALTTCSRRKSRMLGSLFLQWQGNFGPNGHVTKPESRVIEAYTARAAAGCCNGKSVSLADAVVGMLPHVPYLKAGFSHATFLYSWGGVFFFVNSGGGPEKALLGEVVRYPMSSQLEWQGRPN